MDEKVYPWGVPPRVSFSSYHSHVMSLHQSSSPKESVKPVARLVSAHSTLFSYAVQHGEFTPSAGIVLGAPCGPI